MRVSPVVHAHNGFGVNFAYVSKWANPDFVSVSPLVNLEERLFSNKLTYLLTALLVIDN